MGRDLWEITEGTEVLEEDANEANRRKFRKREQQALAAICLSVSIPYQIYITKATNAKEAWDCLASHFEEKSLSKRIYYRRQLYLSRLEKGTSMTAHLNNLKEIAEHLESLDDPVLEKDLVMILLTSLPVSYFER